MNKMVAKRVLVVEDEPDLSAVFVNLLDVFGVKCRVADSASTAKSSLNSDQFDFLIIDLTLPDESGVDLYKEIVVSRPEYRGRAIFTSGMNVTEDLRKIMSEDGISFLAKPFSIEKLKQVLDDLL
jgi:DNA-binding NtrC family response regulator